MQRGCASISPHIKIKTAALFLTLFWRPPHTGHTGEVPEEFAVEKHQSPGVFYLQYIQKYPSGVQ
jgi:hypothetical protein